MTRSEFVASYAKRSGLSDQWAALGVIDVDGKTMFALPCGCEDETCEGWAMVTANSALDHLFFSSPVALRHAYRDTVLHCGGD